MERLKDGDGIWKCDKDNMKVIATFYFLQLFSAQPLLEGYDNLPICFPSLNDNMFDSLYKDVNEEEVRDSLLLLVVSKPLA